MAARRAEAVRIERVPGEAAAVVKVLRMIAIPACPTARPLRTPCTMRTFDTGEFRRQFAFTLLNGPAFALAAPAEQQSEHREWIGQLLRRHNGILPSIFEIQ